MCVSHRGKELIPPCLGLCTVPTISVGTGVQVLVQVYCVVSFLHVYAYLPWHGHVLPRTLIIKIVCVNQLYVQG